MRLERTGRVVQEDSGRSELGELLRLLDELLLATRARAVDEARLELTVGLCDRLARFTEVGDVVQRILEAEDVDPALRRARYETAREVAADRARADQEAPAKRHPERRLRPRFQRADPLPWALDATPHGGVEDTSAGDLEIGEAGAVEKLGQPQQVRCRHAVGKRLLAEQPDRRIDERWHGGEGNSPYALLM